MQTYHPGKGTVLSILAQHGVAMRGQGIPEDRLSEVIELYKSGWSLMRVGEHCSNDWQRRFGLRQYLSSGGHQAFVNLSDAELP